MNPGAIDVSGNNDKGEAAIVRLPIPAVFKNFRLVMLLNIISPFMTWLI